MMAHRERDLTHAESAFIVLAEDEPNFKSFLWLSQDLKVNLFGLQQDT